MQEYIDFVASEWPLFLALLVILAFLVRSFLTGAKGVSPAEAVAMMNNQDAIVVDVRTGQEYETGHITNAVNIPLGVLADRISELADYKSRPIIVACRSGSRSATAASMFTRQGFETVLNLSGGVMAWSNVNLPLTTQVTKKPPVASADSESES